MSVEGGDERNGGARGDELIAVRVVEPGNVGNGLTRRSSEFGVDRTVHSKRGDNIGTRQ